MTYVITEPCIGVCDTACVKYCPVDCIHGPYKTDDCGDGANKLKENNKNLIGLQLYIDPFECIDCGACEPECPVEAIYEENEIPEELTKFIKKNHDFFSTK